MDSTAWRPQEWKSQKDEYLKDYDDYHKSSYEDAFESGANAVLEGLRKEGAHVDLKFGETLHVPAGVKGLKGMVVVIPDDDGGLNGHDRAVYQDVCEGN